MLLTILSNISGFFKIATSYSYLNNHLTFHHFYPDLKILRNCKRLVTRKRFTAITSILYPVGMTKYQD